jgi:hypothetical protein
LLLTAAKIHVYISKREKDAAKQPRQGMPHKKHAPIRPEKGRFKAYFHWRIEFFRAPALLRPL